jgi:hypothetical protein
MKRPLIETQHIPDLAIEMGAPVRVTRYFDRATIACEPPAAASVLEN